ncbi:hypothetical protein DOQ73_23085, partial [Salmonella enterica subsp. enterica]|nr:hypothetical protein [Salmonella enterica subsp. enterica serovar Javiana]
MNNKNHRLLSPSLFTSFEMPRSPTTLDADIARISELGVDFARLDKQHFIALLNHYFSRLSNQEIFHMAQTWLQMPSKHNLWIYSSESVGVAVEK